MASVEDVKAWYTVSGVQHVVAFTKSYWTYTLCEMFCSGLPDESPPAKLRLCRKCRARLPDAKPV